MEKEEKYRFSLNIQNFAGDQEEDDPEIEDEEDEDLDLIDTIKKKDDEIKRLKETTVSKKKYNEVVKKLMNGEGLDKPKEQPVDLKALKKELFSEDSNLSNRATVEKILKIRDEELKLGHKDPFLGVTKNVPSKQDIEKAENVADYLRQCLNECNGNDASFNALFISGLR